MSEYKSIVLFLLRYTIKISDHYLWECERSSRVFSSERPARDEGACAKATPKRGFIY